MDSHDSTPSQPGIVALSAASMTGTLSTATVSTASVTGVFGVQDSVTFIAIPETHPHDQQRRQPLEAIETLSTAPFLIGLGGYMLARRVFRVVRNLDDPDADAE